MNSSVTFDKVLIAPCGINCGTCIAYLRNKNKCCGCRPETGFKVAHCNSCKIKNCDNLVTTDSKFCYDCDKFPCQRLKHIDKRYRIKYKTSLIQNLTKIKEIGIINYLAEESIRWTCPECGSVISVHRDNCLSCKRNLNKKTL